MKKTKYLSQLIVSSALSVPLMSAMACGAGGAGSTSESGSEDEIGSEDSSGSEGGGIEIPAQTPTDSPNDSSEIRKFLGTLQEPSANAATPGVKEVACTPNDTCPPNGPTADGKYTCSYKHWENVEVFDSYAVFQPDLDRLYPGAIFRGGSYLKDGYLDEIIFPKGTRSPIEASFSLENTAESPTIRLDDPTLASYREERNRVLSGQNGNNPTSVQLTMQQVHSEAHFSSAAGVGLAIGAGAPGGGVAAMFGAAFQNQRETKRNMFMLRLRQQNYQVNLTPKPAGEAYFDDDGLLSYAQSSNSPSGVHALSTLINDGVMPVIVSDLFYGRLVLCSVATEASEKDAREAWMSAIAGALVSGGVGVGGGVGAGLTKAQQQIVSESRVDCFVNGGAGSDAVKTVTGVDGIVNSILGSGDQSKQTPGGLIGYRLTTLGNRELPISTTVNYTSEECLKTTGHLTTELSRIQLHGMTKDQLLSGGIDQEVYGKVGVTFPEPGQTLTDCTAAGGVGGKTVLLFDRDRDSYVKVNNEFIVDLGTQSTDAVNIQAGSRVCVFASLYDYDSKFLGLQLNHDDSLGSGSAWVDIGQWDGAFELNLAASVARFRFDLSL